MNIINSKLQFNGHLSTGNKPQYIVVHHAAASKCTIEDIHRWHLNNGWVGCGYHYFIAKDGKIYKGRPDNAIGAHAVNNNSKSLGVCLEGNYQIEQVPEEQLSSLVELILHLKLPIRKHKDLNATSCPGDNFPWDELVQRVSEPVENKGDDPDIIIDEIITLLAKLKQTL